MLGQISDAYKPYPFQPVSLKLKRQSVLFQWNDWSVRFNKFQPFQFMLKRVVFTDLPLSWPSTHAQDLDAIRDPIQRWRAEMTRSSAIIEAFDDFIKDTTIPIDTQQTTLAWWLGPVRQTVCPNLIQKVITTFTIAPMSAGPKRGFYFWC
jgi:hypothetical protein